MWLDINLTECKWMFIFTSSEVNLKGKFRWKNDLLSFFTNDLCVTLVTIPSFNSIFHRLFQFFDIPYRYQCRKIEIPWCIHAFQYNLFHESQKGRLSTNFKRTGFLTSSESRGVHYWFSQCGCRPMRCRSSCWLCRWRCCRDRRVFGGASTVFWSPATEDAG